MNAEVRGSGLGAGEWLEANNRYLGASLHWLRLRLRALASAYPEATVERVPASQPPPPDAPAASGSVPAGAKRSWFARKNVSPEPAPAAGARPLLALPADSEVDPLPDALRARETAALIEPAPALLQLAQRFGLSAFERDVVLLCAGAELDPGLAALFAAAQGHGGRSYPSFALALQALDGASWDALSAQRPLRQARLIELAGAGNGSPLTGCALRVDERIVNYLKGLDAIDERLALSCTALVAASAGAARLTPQSALSASQRDAGAELLARLRASARVGQVPAVWLLGNDPASKVAVARQVCAAIDRQLYRMGIEALVEQRADLDGLARLWQRESALLPIALYVEADGPDALSGEAAAALNAFVAREPGLVFVGARDGSLPAPTAAYALEVHKPSVAEQSAAWCELLGAELPEAGALAGAQLLAGQFDLNLDEIHDALGRAQAAPAPSSLADSAWDACCELTRPRLDALAQRLDPKATWQDLVLPEESLKNLRQISAQVRGRYQVYELWGYGKKMARGRGISALFAGESGTGKTMAAEVIANDLRLHLYRIDLSEVVSKYIGDTEKNLRRLFDAAERGGAILFFDEADALFGKRSEVKDSHDRYANIEINYLLQRMEAFSGVAILATNMKNALDPAFMRRLRFIVNFPFPGAGERQQMWRKAFPRELPQRDLDYERLARFSLSGGNIHSIALNAAFAAAQRETHVTQGLLLAAVRSELRKLDKPINEAEFR